MNSTVENALALELAALPDAVLSTADMSQFDATRGDVIATDPPLPPFRFGRDLWCLTDIKADLAEVPEGSPQTIVQALIRRYITPRGGLIDDPNYGFDVRAYANRGVTLQDLQALNGMMVAEARKDDRVFDVRIRIASGLNVPLRIQVNVTPAEPDVTPFSFTFAVTSADVVMETLTAA